MLSKAIVLCAGEGSRLRPLTFSRPKHLLPVAGKPILGWALDALQDCGISEVAIIIGHRGEEIVQYAGDGSEWGMAVSYLHQDRPAGIGHAVSLAQDFAGDDPFIVYLGDNLFEHGLRAFVETLERDEWDAGLMLKSVPDPQRFGVAEVDGSRVVRVVEKPKDPPSDLAIVGVYAFHRSVFDIIAGLEPSWRGEIEITDAIQGLISSGAKVTASRAQGTWEDAGEPMALLRTNAEWLARQASCIAAGTLTNTTTEGAVVVEEGARVCDCALIGPCRIARGCTVAKAVVGPDVSIDRDCEISETSLRNCIVQQECRVSHLPEGLADSVLGRNVEVRGWADGAHGTPISMLMGDLGHMKAF